MASLASLQAKLPALHSPFRVDADFSRTSSMEDSLCLDIAEDGKEFTLILPSCKEKTSPAVEVEICVGELGCMRESACGIHTDRAEEHVAA